MDTFRIGDLVEHKDKRCYGYKKYTITNIVPCTKGDAEDTICRICPGLVTLNDGLDNQCFGIGANYILKLSKVKNWKKQLGGV
jgi:hypothetical protein